MQNCTPVIDTRIWKDETESSESSVLNRYPAKAREPRTLWAFFFLGAIGVICRSNGTMSFRSPFGRRNRIFILFQEGCLALRG